MQPQVWWRRWFWCVFCSVRDSSILKKSLNKNSVHHHYICNATLQLFMNQTRGNLSSSDRQGCFWCLVCHHLTPSVTVTIFICAASMLEIWKDGLWFWFPGFCFLFLPFILFRLLIKLTDAWSEADLDSNSTCYCLFYSCSAPDGWTLPPQWVLGSLNNSRKDPGLKQLKQFWWSITLLSSF